MGDYRAWFVLLGAILFFVLMRWCFREWRKAVIATLLGPLALGFLWLVSFFAVGIILKFLNALLVAFGLEIPSVAYGIVAMSLSSALVLVLFILYCREQRKQSLLREGSKFGVPYPVGAPNVYRRRF